MLKLKTIKPLHYGTDDADTSVNDAPPAANYPGIRQSFICPFCGGGKAYMEIACVACAGAHSVDRGLPSTLKKLDKIELEAVQNG